MSKCIYYLLIFTEISLLTMFDLRCGKKQTFLCWHQLVAMDKGQGPLSERLRRERQNYHQLLINRLRYPIRMIIYDESILN